MSQVANDILHSNGLNRRRFLAGGSLAVGAFALPTIGLGTASAAEETKRKSAKRAIVILLQGGCSHLDTWDLKPDAPAEFRGEFQSIATSVPGFRICEHLPLLAQRAHQYNVLRSVYHATPS